MSIAPALLPLETHCAPERADGRMVLHNVSWKTYEALVEELGEQHLRLTYDQGELEVMAPSRRHESRKCRLPIVEPLRLLRVRIMPSKAVAAMHGTSSGQYQQRSASVLVQQAGNFAERRFLQRIECETRNGFVLFRERQHLSQERIVDVARLHTT